MSLAIRYYSVISSTSKTVLLSITGTVSYSGMHIETPPSQALLILLAGIAKGLTRHTESSIYS
jgi:hypothetical protein